MLTYCADALKTPEDFTAMESSDVFEEVLQDFHSPWANDKTRMLTMKLLKRALGMERVKSFAFFQRINIFLGMQPPPRLARRFVMATNGVR